MALSYSKTFQNFPKAVQTLLLLYNFYHAESLFVLKYQITKMKNERQDLKAVELVVCYMKTMSKKQSPFPRPMAHRAAPISVSMALGHASANAVEATAGG